MDAQRIKTMVIGIMGEKLGALVQGLRFAYINSVTPLPDPEVNLIPRFVGTGGVAVDVGANGASWTKALHAVVGASRRVFAFEADPLLRPCDASRDPDHAHEGSPALSIRAFR